jgi:hypothetical protein
MPKDLWLLTETVVGSLLGPIVLGLILLFVHVLFHSSDEPARFYVFLAITFGPPLGAFAFGHVEPSLRARRSPRAFAGHGARSLTGGRIYFRGVCVVCFALAAMAFAAVR